MNRVLGWLRQIAAHSPTILVGLAVVYVADATLAAAWFAASRAAYVLFVGLSLRGVSNGRARHRAEDADSVWRRFRDRASWLMDNDAAAFCALCIVTSGAQVLATPRWFEIAVGAVLVLIGAGVKIWATASIDEGSYHWRSFFVPHENGNLSAVGPYRWLADPMYTIGYAHAYGIALLLGSWPGLLAAAGAQAAILALNAIVEKPHVEERRKPPSE